VHARRQNVPRGAARMVYFTHKISCLVNVSGQIGRHALVLSVSGNVDDNLKVPRLLNFNHRFKYYFLQKRKFYCISLFCHNIIFTMSRKKSRDQVFDNWLY